MSYFSNQLRVTLEKLEISRSRLAEVAEIPAATLHNYFHGTGRGPDATVLERLCSAIEDLQDRAELVIAHLRDETPSSAADLIRILSLVNNRVEEEPPKTKLPKSVREDFDFLEQMATKHPEVVDSVRSTVRILRGR